MKQDAIASGKRKPINLTMDTGIVEAARAVGINISQVSEAAVRDAVRIERDRLWQEENRVWIDAHRQWVETNGLPLEKYRLF